MDEKPKPQKTKTAKTEAPKTEPEKAFCRATYETKAQKPQTPETEAPKTEPEKAFCRTTYKEKGYADPSKMRDISEAEITQMRDVPAVLAEENKSSPEIE